MASAAKAGQDTRGYEVALNQNKRHSITPAQAVKPMPKPEPITEVALSSQGRAQPAPLHKPLPVQAEPLKPTQANYYVPTNNYVAASNVSNLEVGKIYVQAGSFSQEQNALQLSSQLSTYGSSKVYMTRVNNRPFFRVRLGPYDDKNQARDILTALNESGNKNAVIVVD